MNENKQRRKLTQKQRKTWTRWLRGDRLLILILFNIGIGYLVLHGPFLLILKKQVFSKIQEQIEIEKKIMAEKSQEEETDERKKEFKVKKIAAESVLQIFMISNQIIQDREKICQEINDPHEQYSKLMILFDRLTENNKKIPFAAYKFSDFFNKDILHEAREVFSVVQRAEQSFQFCERSKDITSALVQQKRLMLSQKLRNYLLEEGKQFNIDTES